MGAAAKWPPQRCQIFFQLFGPSYQLALALKTVTSNIPFFVHGLRGLGSDRQINGDEDECMVETELSKAILRWETAEDIFGKKKIKA